MTTSPSLIKRRATGLVQIVRKFLTVMAMPKYIWLVFDINKIE